MYDQDDLVADFAEKVCAMILGRTNGPSIGRSLRELILLVAFVATLHQGGPAGADDNTHSDLKSDERVVVFTTDAWLSENGTWTIPLHVWVHELERATVTQATLAASLEARYELKATKATAANFSRRTRLLAADNERGKLIVVTVAGQAFELPETMENGHALDQIQLDARLVAKHAVDGTLQVTTVLPDDDTRSFEGTVNLIPPRGISVISDLDDTVKVTHVTDERLMVEQTFFRDFQAVPGMAKQYASWHKGGASLHFVSSSPWHLYEPLDEFLTTSGFPPRSMSLKYFRFRDSSLWNLFRAGTETKPPQIRTIINGYPDRHFVLVGDSGEQDPEVYAAVLREFPQQIVRIYIRNVTNASRNEARFAAAFKDIDSRKWRLFKDPRELSLPK